jgi:uncharacterized integral membrane protein
MKIKLGISLLLAFLIILFVTQNTEVVQVTFLAWSVQVSLVLLVFIMLWVGMVLGWLLNSYLRFSRARKRKLAENPPVEDTPVQEQVEQSSQAEDAPVVAEEKQEV